MLIVQMLFSPFELQLESGLDYRCIEKIDENLWYEGQWMETSYLRERDRSWNSNKL